MNVFYKNLCSCHVMFISTPTHQSTDLQIQIKHFHRDSTGISIGKIWEGVGNSAEIKF